MNITDQEFADSQQDREQVYRDELHRPPQETHLDDLGLGRWPTDYYVLRVEGKDHEAAKKEVRHRIRAAAGVPDPEPPDPIPPTPTPTPWVTPLQGYLRIYGNQPQGPTFGDDTGPRIARFCSYFPAIRIAKDTFSEFERQLDVIAQYYQGARIFWHLGTPWWIDQGRNVNPLWPGFDGLVYRVGRAFIDRGLKIQLTAGDLQVLSESTKARLFTDIPAMFRACGDETLLAVSEMVNEARVNSAEGDDWPYWIEKAQRWRAASPWGQLGLSDAAEFEEPEAMAACAQSPATLALKHGTRDRPTDALRRAFNVRYEGYHAKPTWEGEPTGLGADVYQPLPTKAWCLGLHTILQITGQGYTHFHGPSVLAKVPLESEWSFTNLPKRWKDLAIPEDFGTTSILRPGHKSDAPVGARTFADAGEGPARCDGAFTSNLAYYVPQGGSGRWRIFSRLWDADYRIVGPDGIEAEGRVSAGADLPTALDASKDARVVILHKR